MTAHLRAAIHTNFKDTCRKQETRKEKNLSRKSIIDSEERVLKIIAAINEHKNPFAFRSTRKSKWKTNVTGSVVGSEHLKDIRSKSNRKWASGLFHQWVIFWRKGIILRFSKEAKFGKRFQVGTSLLYVRNKKRNDHSEDKRKSIFLIGYRQ